MNRRGSRRTLLAIGALVVSAGLAGCNGANDRDGTGDAPVGKTDPQPVDVINMPDGFSNVATKCVAFQPGKRIYQPSNNKGNVQPVIVDDPNCTGGAPGTSTATTTQGTTLR